MIQLPKLTSLEPVRILFDPIWSDRASPHQSAGPRRRLPPPCELEDLPDFQYVVTSHNQCVVLHNILIRFVQRVDPAVMTTSTGRR